MFRPEPKTDALPLARCDSRHASLESKTGSSGPAVRRCGLIRSSETAELATAAHSPRQTRATNITVANVDTHLLPCGDKCQLFFSNNTALLAFAMSTCFYRLLASDFLVTGRFFSPFPVENRTFPGTCVANCHRSSSIDKSGGFSQRGW